MGVRGGLIAQLKPKTVTFVAEVIRADGTKEYRRTRYHRNPFIRLIWAIEDRFRDKRKAPE